MILTQTRKLENCNIPDQYGTQIKKLVVSGDVLRIAKYISGIFLVVNGPRFIRLLNDKPKTLLQNFHIFATFLALSTFINSCFAKQVIKNIAVQNVPEEEKVNPKYRILETGVNYEGECVNKVCDAYKKYVIIVKGLGVFNFFNEKTIRHCPACHQNIPVSKIKSLIFVDCTTIILGLSSQITHFDNTPDHRVVLLKTLLEENELQNDDLPGLDPTIQVRVFKKRFSTKKGDYETYEFLPQYSENIAWNFFKIVALEKDKQALDS